MLNKDIATRLRSGALVVVVEEADELLALEAAKVASMGQFAPVKTVTAAQPDALDIIEAHKKSKGTLIASDILRAYGQNPMVTRLIREIALQRKDNIEDFSRLILLEVPGTEVPVSLRGDIEMLSAKMPDTTELLQELKDFIGQHGIKHGQSAEELYSLSASVAGLSRHEAARLFARCWIENGKKLDAVWLRREKASRVSDRLSGALTFIEPNVPDVGGLDGLKGWLEDRRQAFASDKARKFGLPEPKGLLLLGSPGTGKSLVAKTIAKSWGLPLLRFDMGKVFGSLIGQSESQTRQAIEAAEACSPCILYIDEIEKGLSSGSGQTDGGTSQRVLGTFLTWLQDKTKPVFVVATANRISALPPELLRKGRFDEIFFVDLPSQVDRESIIRIHIERHKRKPGNYRVKDLAKLMAGFSGAEIEQAVIDAMFNAFGKRRDFTSKDIKEAAESTTPLSTTMAEDINRLKTWSVGRARMASTNVSQAPSNVTAPRRAPVAAGN